MRQVESNPHLGCINSKMRNMRNIIEFDLPLKEKSIITFVINNNVYKCRLINVGNYYVSLINDEFLENGVEKKDLFHDEFVSLIFDKTLGKPPKEYYEEIFPDQSFSGCWPESTLKELEKVLTQMKKDFEILNQRKPILQFDRFRFRIGDIILYEKTKHKILGYYFSEGFNNYKRYGYVIDNIAYGHDGNNLGYDEYGNKLVFDDKEEDKWFIREDLASPIKNNQINNNLKQNENGNEIKLPRTKSIISRGKVPEGHRICCKVYKTAISVKSLSYSTIFGGGQE